MLKHRHSNVDVEVGRERLKKYEPLRSGKYRRCCSVKERPAQDNRGHDACNEVFCQFKKYRKPGATTEETSTQETAMVQPPSPEDGALRAADPTEGRDLPHNTSGLVRAQNVSVMNDTINVDSLETFTRSFSGQFSMAAVDSALRYQVIRIYKGMEQHNPARNARLGVSLQSPQDVRRTTQEFTELARS
ncbi:hypothetical protein N0V83_008381 [Neocucurbitaria cava]|uniref:Uncharacterized protein n=1 Tax=Neocucurbitaria cava TaxID=798079 RepID=A0A9W8Y4Z9_9PLEO|nr:hypothetical protein N0V83_008381 [Neocucurbitaria cava]